MNEHQETTEKQAVQYGPSMTFYHANAKGTGGALSLGRIPATLEEEGCLMARFANQLTVGNRQGPEPVYPRFDWENKIVVKLNFNDLCKMIQVFRGECEAMGEEGKGLYHRASGMVTRINLQHLLEPKPGYSFEVYRTKTTGEELRSRVFLSTDEATGICRIIEDSLALICFGSPMEARHGVAA